MLLLIYKPLVFDSHLFGVGLASGVQVYGFFWKTSSGMFPYSVLLGLTVVTCSASVYVCFW